jgi:transglycosylase-like protein with SLT domain
LLPAARMRLRWLVLALVAPVAACGPMRGAGLTGLGPQVASETPAAQAVAAPESDGLHHIAHPSIDAWERRLRSERKWRVATEGGVARGAETLPRVRALVTESGLPAGLALLPVIESGYRSNARGPGGSVGIWQFQAPTARRFGLAVSKRRDDRLDPEHSTRAAIRYLRLLYDRYDDWPLALAAYNLGEGKVDQALARRPGASLWELTETQHLPAVSREYVSHFLAVVRVVDDSPDASVVARGDDSM